MLGLLVKSIDAVHPDKTKDRRGMYKRGDIVRIVPPHQIGGAVTNDKFFLIIIPDRDINQVTKLYEEPERDISVEFDSELHADVEVKRRRLFFVRLGQLPPKVKQSLAKDRQATVPWNVIRRFIRNKKTNLDQ